MNDKMIKELLEEIANYRRDVSSNIRWVAVDESCWGEPVLVDDISKDGDYVSWYDVESILLKRLGGRWG